MIQYADRGLSRVFTKSKKMVRFLKFLSVFVFVVNVVAGAFCADIPVGTSSRDCDNSNNGIGVNTSTNTAALRADWIANTIGISWYNGDQQVSGVSSCTYDGTFNVPSAPTKTGYVFDGWLLTALPSAYTRLAYLESTGTQCIDTGVTLSSDNIVYKWAALDNSTNSGTTLFGSEGGSPKTYSDPLYGNKTGRKVYIGSGSTVNTTASSTVGYYVSSDNAFHTWSFVIRPDNTLYLVKDGTALSTVSWGGSLNKSVTAALFCNHSGSNFTEKSWAAFKYFKIYDNNNLVFDGIPARRNSDGVLGMYDTVSKTFLTNVGSGTFTAGPDILVPSNYTQLEYIASTGAQYIDTGVTLTSDNVVYEWEGRDDKTSGSATLFGGETSSGNKYTGLLYGNVASRKAYIGSTGGINTMNYVSSAGEFYTWVFSINSDHTASLSKDGNTVANVSWSGSLNKTQTIALFANHNGSNYAEKNSAAFKYFKIYDNNNLVFDGIPARRNSDDELGLYDTVTGEFFINAGTGTFTAGPDL